MTRKLFIWFYKLSPGINAAITSSFVVVAFVGGALLEDRVQKITGDQPGDWPIGVSWILASFCLAAVWGGLRYWYSRSIESHTKRIQAHERAIADARERIAKLSVQHLAECDALMESTDISIDSIRSVLICEAKRIDELITAAWAIINSHHNVNATATERINFELTLITPSLRDAELTIASWCNRDHRRPKSLLLRDSKDKRIYQRTAAAKVIEQGITDTVIIEDTCAPTANYESLYDGQKARIRSSVLYSVLSPKSEHLGILVLHCEREKFFRNDDRRYWHELLAVFAPSIALELERIKAFNRVAENWPGSPGGRYTPY
jgi:hypothetical protein